MMPLDAKTRVKILNAIKKRVQEHHINVASIDYKAWFKEVDERADDLLTSKVEEFEDGVRRLLGELKSSHTAFYHDRPTRFPSQHTIGATFHSAVVNGPAEWMLLDVFDNGPAQLGGLRPGDILKSVDGVVQLPPTLPTFAIGKTHVLKVARRGASDIDVDVVVPERKGTKQRPPIVEPKSLSCRLIEPGVGLLRVLYFPGMMGMGFAGELDQAVKHLKEQRCERLIVDLRGNIGGSLGFVRLASYLCPGKTPIGHSLTPERLKKGYTPDELPRVPMPATRFELLMTLAKFSFRDKSVMLLTQGLGPQRFHGKIVVLVNEWTTSAGEMAAAFSAENHFAIVVGEKTRGTVLGAMNFEVGGGYWLRLPVFGWFTAKGLSLEGTGVTPDVQVPVQEQALASGEDNQMLKAVEIAKGL